MTVLLISESGDFLDVVQDCVKQLAKENEISPKIIACPTCLAPAAIAALNAMLNIDLLVIEPAPSGAFDCGLTPKIQQGFIDRFLAAEVPVLIVSDEEENPAGARRANYYAACCPKADNVDYIQFLDSDWVAYLGERVKGYKQLRQTIAELKQLEDERDGLPLEPARSDWPRRTGHLRLVVVNG